MLCLVSCSQMATQLDIDCFVICLHQLSLLTLKRRILIHPLRSLPLLERSVLAVMPFVPIGWWTPVPSTTPASPGCFRSSVRVLKGRRKTFKTYTSSCQLSLEVLSKSTQVKEEKSVAEIGAEVAAETRTDGKTGRDELGQGDLKK